MKCVVIYGIGKVKIPKVMPETLENENGTGHPGNCWQILLWQPVFSGPPIFFFSKKKAYLYKQAQAFIRFFIM